MELGNQQERHEGDLHWLGGFFDGEGCISICATKRPYLWMTVCVRLVNTNEQAIERVSSILSRHHIAHHVAAVKASKLGNRPTKHVHIAGFGRCKAALELLGPYFRVKKNEADLLLEFIASRQSGGRRAQYSEREIDIYVMLRQLHGQKLRESSETLRRGLLEARYSPITARKTVKAAEMTASVGVQ